MSVKESSHGHEHLYPLAWSLHSSHAFRYLIIAYVGFNGLLFAAMLYVRYSINAVKDWPSTPGTITESRAITNYSRKGQPWISYKYEVNGKKHTGYGITPGAEINDPAFAREVLTRFPKGAEVTVYYNPKNPSSAVLDRDSISQKYMWGWFWLGNLLMPVIILLGTWLMKL